MKEYRIVLCIMNYGNLILFYVSEGVYSKGGFLVLFIVTFILLMREYRVKRKQHKPVLRVNDNDLFKFNRAINNCAEKIKSVSKKEKTFKVTMTKNGDVSFDTPEAFDLFTKTFTTKKKN
ncbi:hypothetical protein ACJRPK_13925 [Aquimarina sp. 2-A2]|uniref:hypothetical protein n=1 Tax=Aquimarina sp. 2-A2 TaxID=3382644 RepID=UPI00387F1B34